MPRKVIITINPVRDGEPSQSATDYAVTASGCGTAVIAPESELLLYPKPVRLKAEAVAAVSLKEKR